MDGLGGPPFMETSNIWLTFCKSNMIQPRLADLKKSSVKPARCIILGTVTASINDKEVRHSASGSAQENGLPIFPKFQSRERCS